MPKRNPVDTKYIDDREANLFAENLLVPDSLLEQAVKKIGFLPSYLDEAEITKLAKIFGVTVPLMTKRLMDTNLLAPPMGCTR